MNEREQQLWANYIRTRSDADRNALVMRYENLASNIAKKMARNAPRCVDPDDVYQAGILGLMDAITRFDPARGIKPTTFLDRRIRGAILDWQREVDFAPRLTRTRETKYNRAVDALQHKLDRVPTDDEIRDQLQLSEYEYEKVKREATGVVYTQSLDAEFASEQKRERKYQFHDSLVDQKAEDPHDAAERTDTINWILRKLQPRVSFFLIHYFLMDKKMADIGREVGSSESRISQLVNHAIRQARAAA